MRVFALVRCLLDNLAFMAGSDEHLKPLRLFDLARNGGSQITEEERAHLRVCEECQRLLAVFIRQFAKTWGATKPEDAA
jgi:hypothetical protein